MQADISFDPLLVEINASIYRATDSIGETQSQVDADDEANSPHPSMQPLQIMDVPRISESKSTFSPALSMNFLPLPWHDRQDLRMQLVGTPTMVKSSRWTKITMVESV